MTKPRLKTEHAARFLIAAIAGVLLALSFPKFSVAGLAWIAPGLLLFSALGCAPAAGFRVAYFGGFVFYLCSLYWLLHIPVPYLPILGWIALSLYLALYPATWVWLTWQLFPSPAPPRHRHPWNGELLQWLLHPGWWARAFWCIKSAALWVALEMILGRFLSGFPWDFLGVSQYEMLPIIQIASFTGVYGVSFLIIWFSASLLAGAVALSRKPSPRASWLRELALPLATLLLAGLLGMRTARSYAEAIAQAPTVKAALVQPSIPQTLIWDEKENANRFRQLMELSREALASHPEIIIWPEASVPNMLRHHEETAQAVIGMTTEFDVWAILGSDDAEMRPGGLTARDISYFNSAFSVSPDGELAGIYRKRRLVIFGEYVPFVRWLPFLRFFSPAGESGFTPGKGPIPFHLDSINVITSVLICFEDTFPHLVRDYVKSNTDFLVNLTNNGWFGESAAQWQHAATAAFRAVENRIPLVRCANNGLTCWVDPAGGMHEVYFPGSDDIYKAGFKTVSVPVLPPGTERELSFYTRHGDVFGWGCTAWIGAIFLGRKIQARRTRKSTSRTIPAA